jgi:putative intracellular protease/amidase
MGAQVDLLSRLWGQKSIKFVSDVDSFEKDLATTMEKLQVLEVSEDFRNVKPEDYAAVLIAANYVSVRLRYFRPVDVTAGDQDMPGAAAPPAAIPPIDPAMVREAPAVRFFAAAMANPNIVKGALCHGLWILTPRPDLLAGRRIICHEVVIADAVNAGAIYIPVAADGAPPTQLQPAQGVVVDRDLITGNSYHVAADAPHPYINAIRDTILRLAASRKRPPVSAVSPIGRPIRTTRREILVLLSEWGYWGEELVAPMEEFRAADYGVTFCTPTGKRPNCISVSKAPIAITYVDPPLGRCVTTPEMAEEAAKWDDPSTPDGSLLDNPRSLATWFPERPYFSAPSFLRALEAYNRAIDTAVDELSQYDALLIVGGSGPIVDLVNNQRVHDLILGFYRTGKPIAAECYGVACLAFARDLIDRTSIIRGKNVTGHCLEYDYKDGTGFMKARDTFLDFDMGPPPYPLEYILRDATAPDGQYHGNFGKPLSVIVDYPFITGRSTPDSRLTGQKLIEVLDGDPPLRRWGW